MDESLSAEWFGPLFRAEGMRRVFSDRGRLQGILDFEAALTQAEARAGVVSTSSSATIAAHCRAELFDIAALSQATALAGNSAIPIIQELMRRVGDASLEAAQFVHFGATSQDAMDTGLVLQVRQALDLVEEDIAQLCAALVHRAAAYKETPLAGRTWLQHAAPTTFGLKVAGWLDAMTRHLERIRALRPRILVLQFGGAVGTLAALGDQAERTASLLAEELHLALPALPWHAHRDRLAEVATTLGLVIGTLGKIARDISLMAQSEIAEVAEPSVPGRGGSSSMPHKRNPIGCAAVLAAAMRVPALVSIMLTAMTQDHERGLGGWQAEWETLPEVFALTAGALAHTRHVISDLIVDPARMRANLDATRGLIYAETVSTALARPLGHAAAHALVERACRRAIEQRQHLQEVLSDDTEVTAVLSAAQLKELFDPRRDIQCAAALVDRSLAAAAGTISASRKEEM